jgi:uncharacterized membrane protein (GlpM family)
LKEAAILACRALLGGTFVALFSIVGELLRPKSFAGIFAAAPSVALASLLITDVTRGEQVVWMSGLGMIAGAVAMVAACTVAVDSVKRFRALKGSVAALAVWVVTASGLYVVALR